MAQLHSQSTAHAPVVYSGPPFYLDPFSGRSQFATPIAVSTVFVFASVSRHLANFTKLAASAVLCGSRLTVQN